MAGATAPPLAAALLAVPAAPAYSRARAATSSSTVSRPSSSPTTTPTSCPTGSTRTSDAPNLGHPTSPSQPPTVATMKLAMEVADAAELSAKNGGASCNPFVEVEFDGQRQRTATRPGDLSPHWNETLVFDVRDPARLSALTVDVSIQHDRSLNDHNAIRPHAFLGRVRVSGDSVARSPYEAVVQRYPLHKRGLFSRLSGDIALRLYLVADTRDGDCVTQDHAAPSVDTGGGLQQNLQQPSQPAAWTPRGWSRTSSPARSRQELLLPQGRRRRKPMGRVATTRASSAPFGPRQASATSLGATRSTPWRRLPLRRDRRWSCRSPRDLPRHRLPARSTARSAAASGGAAAPAIGCGWCDLSKIMCMTCRPGLLEKRLNLLNRAVKMIGSF
ncbi:Multiple C2 and transmembrane domain-containing protein 1 [Hordeum vulgare]|nr:Multiple C2 and transmembrane domain-containing protein 1 [Hordeum vulgare]